MKDDQLLALLERLGDEKVVDAEDGHRLTAEGLAIHFNGRFRLTMSGLETLRKLQAAQPTFLRPSLQGIAHRKN